MFGVGFGIGTRLVMMIRLGDGNLVGGMGEARMMQGPRRSVARRKRKLFACC